MESACLDFINSEFRDLRGRWIRDYLLEPTWLERFLTQWNLQVSEAASPEIITDLLALRKFLRGLIERLSTGPLTPEDMTALNSIMHKAPVKRSLNYWHGSYQLELAPQLRDWRWVQAEIAASFVELLTQHDPRNIKICENSDCLAVFYDESRSHTRRFCTSDKCANLLKVRRFRARHQRSASVSIS
ncbi:zf-CGNR multi-domain protein [Ktedonosporobacter rubrisoli]|uniref:Zf-CGNR multi-domain protein n=1 Tax=Ktedonosporobacter rubrisoli TaxID=2509675 RepID=A0A4P6JX27_KTERU|nr:CGNR zinc finger domain-containing protein [Ktedonosporobacter rubrisoli]QBD80174.1 zf-CGNR multi-domain protein [Ktedonosporobacter rubrisoli]